MRAIKPSANPAVLIQQISGELDATFAGRQDGLIIKLPTTLQVAGPSYRDQMLGAAEQTQSQTSLALGSTRPSAIATLMTQVSGNSSTVSSPP
jgi:hypothetical protein